MMWWWLNHENIPIINCITIWITDPFWVWLLVCDSLVFRMNSESDEKSIRKK